MIFSVIHWKGTSGFYWQIQRESTRTTTKRLFYLYHSLPHDSRSVLKSTEEKEKKPRTEFIFGPLHSGCVTGLHNLLGQITYSVLISPHSMCFFQEELPMEKALVHTSCKNLFIMINSNAKRWLKNYHTIESVLSGGTQNKETYWVCLSKGQAALKREEKRRGGERKERERREGRGVFSWTDL